MEYVGFGGSVFDPLQVSLEFNALRLEAVINSLKISFCLTAQIFNLLVLRIKAFIHPLEVSFCLTAQIFNLLVLRIKAFIHPLEVSFCLTAQVFNLFVLRVEAVFKLSNIRFRCDPSKHANHDNRKSDKL